MTCKTKDLNANREGISDPGGITVLDTGGDLTVSNVHTINSHVFYLFYLTR